MEPKEDMATCSNCGWTGPCAECETELEGDWESGYYDVHLCPKCEDGGCIDDYYMSDRAMIQWNIWNFKRWVKMIWRRK